MDEARKLMFLSVLLYGAVFCLGLIAAGIGLQMPMVALCGVLVAGLAYLTQVVGSFNMDPMAPRWLALLMYPLWAASIVAGVVGCLLLMGA